MAHDFSALAFGEVMIRLSPPGDERIAKGNSFVKHAGGSELNVISGIARLGLRTGLISKLPASPVGTYVRNQIRSYGVSDDYVIDDAGPQARLGLYYYEGGAYPRKPQVVYDRANSSFTTASRGDFPENMYGKTQLFHTSGISLALCPQARETCIAFLKAFREAGARISFDVNYREALWSEEEARKTICAMLPHIDVLFVSEETSRRMLQRKGTLEEIQRGYHEEFGVDIVASTKRTILTPRSHNFTSQLYAAKENAYYTEKPYENIDVVDRVGSGDAYVAGVLYALLSRLPHQEAVAYGNAMSAVKNTIPGDLITTDLTEIKGVIADHHATGFVSEMRR